MSLDRTRHPSGLSLVAAPSVDETVSGIYVHMVAGETVSVGHAVYAKSDGKAWKADNDDVADGKLPAVGLVGGAVGGSFSADDPIQVVVLGFVRQDGTFTAGTLYWLGTGGGKTATQPSSTDNVIQLLGVTLTSDLLFVNPSLDWMTHT